jgi:hypothetical protein
MNTPIQADGHEVELKSCPLCDAVMILVFGDGTAEGKNIATGHHHPWPEVGREGCPLDGFIVRPQSYAAWNRRSTQAPVQGKIDIPQDWCLRMAELEGDQEIGAGALPTPMRVRELEKAIDYMLDQIGDADRGIGSSDTFHDGLANLKAVRAGMLAKPEAPVQGMADAKEFDANVDRLKACEHIADGDEGWQALRNECPSTAAVARLRDAYATTSHIQKMLERVSRLNSFRELNDLLPEIRTVLSSSAPVQRRDIAYLIERRVSPPQYITGGADWSSDPWHAQRYETARHAQDAHAALPAYMRNDARVVEHLFVYAPVQGMAAQAELVRAVGNYIRCSTAGGSLSPYIRENGHYGTKSPWVEVREAYDAAVAAPVQGMCSPQSAGSASGGESTVKASLCGCMTCCDERGKHMPVDSMDRFPGPSMPGWTYGCVTCGNKRCPHHTSHLLECTGSNEPGQAGSIFMAPSASSSPISAAGEE